MTPLHPNIARAAAVALLSVIAVACARVSPDAERQMLGAASLLESRPDSALTLLDSITPSALPASVAARYALLRSAALDKAGMPIADDSLIRSAARYYSGRGDSLEVKSQFYLGVALRTTGTPDDALYHLTRAHNTALQASTPFYAAMAAREIASIYGAFSMPKERLKWSKHAKSLFHEASKPVHEAWMTPDILSALTFSGKFDEARGYWDSIDADLYRNNPYYRYELLRARIELGSQTHDYADVKLCYDSLARDGYPLRAHDYCRLAEVSLHFGNTSAASALLDSASAVGGRSVDSLHIDKLNALLEFDLSDYKTSAQSAISAYRRMAKAADNILLSSPNSLLIENMRLRVENERTEAEKQRQRVRIIIIIGAALLIIAVLVLLHLKNKIKANRMEALNYLAQAERLRSELKEKNMLLDQTSTQATRASETQQRLMREKEEIACAVSNLQSDISQLFDDHLSIIKMISSATYSTSNSAVGGKQIKKAFTNFLNPANQKAFTDRLERSIDEHGNGWMSRFKAAYPDLNERQYALAAYLYLGFTSESIATLMGKESVNAVYMDKTRLKNKMLRLNGGLNDEFIRALKMDRQAKCKSEH